MRSDPVNRILIYRLGSIGDFVVSLPCFHLIRRRYPSAEIALLTNRPAEAKAAPAASVLQGSGFVDRYITYPLGTRDTYELRAVQSELLSFQTHLLVYLAAPRGMAAIYRDYLFFRWCGIRKIIGMPFLRDARQSRFLSGGDRPWEPEALRLGRNIKELGPIDADRAENWDLGLTDQELATADRILERLPPQWNADRRLIGMSVGTKQPVNDWGEQNWHEVLEGIKSPDLALMLTGAADERDYSQRVARDWPGPVLNVCGETSPRESAAVIKRTRLFLCHDSGPMHLAAAVGTPCVAVFSKLNPPGKWFPFGAGHKIFYPPAEADSILAIQPADVIAAVRKTLVGE